MGSIKTEPQGPGTDDRTGPLMYPACGLSLPGSGHGLVGGVILATYDPHDPVYWDATDLEHEVDRVFDICNGCRLCYNLCPSFPTLLDGFDALDDEGRAGQPLPLRVKQQVESLCYECKLCYDKCPYTPPHRFALDFPRLILRVRAQRARKDGLRPADRYLGDPDRMGRAGTAMAPLANWSARLPAARRLMEKTMGIDHRRNLPQFAPKTFRRWFRDRKTPVPAVALPVQPGPVRDPGEATAPPQIDTSRVAFFATCLVNYQHPEVGQSAVAVLEHHGVRVEIPKREVCCGMPALDGGDMERAQGLAQQNVQALLPMVRQGMRILIPEPTCGFMVKKEYPVILGTPEAQEVASAALDLGEYLAQRVKTHTLREDFSGAWPEEILYHVPCHLRAQNMGVPVADVLSILPGTHIEAVTRCSGMDGTWGMKAGNFERSMDVARRLLNRIGEASSETSVCSDCALAGLQIEQGTGRKVRHPVEVLARAYGLEDGGDHETHPL